MPHSHSPAEPHVTKTFGLRTVIPIPMMWVLRLGPRHKDPPDDEKHRIMEVVERWIGRWAVRSNMAWGNVHVAATESDDALVIGFLAVAGLPDDWFCLGGMVGDLFSEQHDHGPQMIPVILDPSGFPGFKLPDLPEIEPDEKPSKPN